MKIKKLTISKGLHYSPSKTSSMPLLKRLRKTENKKDQTFQNYFPKKYEQKNIKILYKPLHPKYKYDTSSMGINEMIKKDNLPLITNDSLKNMILKFRKEREKEMLEKRFVYKDKSFEDYKKEKNTQFLMLRAMLRRDPLTIQSLMKRNRNEERKLKRNISMNALRKKNSKNKNFNKTTIISESNLAPEKSMYNNSSMEFSGINLKKKFSKLELWKKDFLLKTQNIKKAFLKKHEIKIRNAYSLILSGRFSPFKVTHFSNKKFNQDCVYINTNLMSAKLGEISLFGIFDGNGQYGKGIAQAFKNYVVDYFKNGNEMRVNLKKDNFYSIMYNSFVHAQNYLINNSNKLNINMNYSGATGIVVLYPHNETNKIYCANLGRNKCIFYSMMGPIRLSYELYPNRASEKDRIALFKEQYQKELNDKKEKDKENKDNIEENINNNKNSAMNNNMMDNNTDKNNIENNINKIVHEKKKNSFLKEFLELDISRCIGNLAAEEFGIIPGPEIGESDVKINKGKFVVMGTESLWKYISDDEVGDIVNTHYFANDNAGACKELQELARDRWKEKNDGAYDDISVVIIFFDNKNL